MHYVYILQSTKSKTLYIGFTADLRKRLEQHNKGESLSTKAKRPWILVYYEAYRVKKDAIKRELKLKQYKNSYTRLKQRIENCFL